jgi:cytochrome oxidase Cu insertion factor (SCO1/SenC/PrrC family)
MNDRQKSGRRAFLLINFLFFGPLAIAVFIYATGNWRPAGSTENGEFLWPPVTIPDITLAEANGPEPRKHLRGVWNVLYTGPGECDVICQERLVDLRQMRLTFGKDAPRLQLVYLADSGSVDSEYMTTEHPVMFVVDATQSGEQLSALEGYATGDVYLVDPQGNVILRYPPDMSIAEMREDVKKLLKLSQIG